jgi:hypothetical protein
MHIILDSNIYAADYRMDGVAFQSLFEYMRRTESKLVLPLVIREEVVVSYGRRLRSESKAFADAWYRYRHVDLAISRGTFQKPDIKTETKKLMRKLMKPMDGVKPIYIPDIKGPFMQDAFMRGIHRKRPANENGEELRDVILWLWALAYSDTADDQVVFISDDGGFWKDDGVHPDIDHDVRAKNGKLYIHRSILEFLKNHAPAPVDITGGWLQQHFEIQAIERELIDRASRELDRMLGGVVGISIEHHAIRAGKVYDVSPDAQFAELQIPLVFKFTYISPAGPESPIYGGGLFQTFAGQGLGQPWSPAALLNRAALSAPSSGSIASIRSIGSVKANPVLRCEAEAEISLRIKNNKTTEVSVAKLKIDRAKFWAQLYQTPASDTGEPG